MVKLSDFEKRVLVAVGGGGPVPWGAAVSVALEFLSENGLVTDGPHYRITDVGRTALAQYEGREQ